jgi:hypothetical protein
MLIVTFHLPQIRNNINKQQTSKNTKQNQKKQPKQPNKRATDTKKRAITTEMITYILIKLPYSDSMIRIVSIFACTTFLTEQIPIAHSIEY